MPAASRITEAEFLQLPESPESPESVAKIELLDGEVIVSSPPALRHQLIVKRLLRALDDWAAARSPMPTVACAPLDIRFGRDRILQPDVFVYLDPLPADSETPVDRIPDLVVEVLSTNRVYDRVAKRYVYAEAGVREYWTVDTGGLIDRHAGPSLSEVSSHSDSLLTPLLPRLFIDIFTLVA